jgi:hypothetical protein
MKHIVLKAGLIALALLLFSPSTQAEELPNLSLLQQQVRVSTNLSPISPTTAAVNFHNNSEIAKNLYLMYNVNANQQLHILFEGSLFENPNFAPYNFNCRNNRAVGTTLFGNNETDNPSCENRNYTNTHYLTFSTVPTRVNNQVVEFNYSGLTGTNLKLHIVLIIGSPDPTQIPQIVPATSAEPNPAPTPETTIQNTPPTADPPEREQPLTDRERLKQERRQLILERIERRKVFVQKIRGRLEEKRKQRALKDQDQDKNEDESPTVQNNQSPEPTVIDGNNKTRVQILQERRAKLLLERNQKDAVTAERQELLNNARRIWGQINIAYGAHKSQSSLSNDIASTKTEADSIKANLNNRTNAEILQDIERLRALKNTIGRVKGLESSLDGIPSE